MNAQLPHQLQRMMQPLGSRAIVGLGNRWQRTIKLKPMRLQTRVAYCKRLQASEKDGKGVVDDWIWPPDILLYQKTVRSNLLTCLKSILKIIGWVEFAPEKHNRQARQFEQFPRTDSTEAMPQRRLFFIVLEV